MHDAALHSSLAAGGPHHLLHRLVGRWEGRVRTWFEPDALADDSPIRGECRAVLGARFVQHEYETCLKGAPLHGVALHGFDLQARRFVTSWVDEFHMGTGVMLLEGRPDPEVGSGFEVAGSYADPTGGPRWGWRIGLELEGDDRLAITHWNVTPGGIAARAIEIRYVRVPG
ncbi:MAG: DUF1579 domain-containing protein [Planctomycetes bacterium]|nr:DUF1579 domain-containing protein [Planctomycetota bacterium]